MEIRALALDTGGTVLDWHGRMSDTLRTIGERRGLSADWPAITNEYRRRTMKDTVGRRQPAINMDGVHAAVLDPTWRDFGLPSLHAEDRAEILAAWHQLNAWSDVVPAMTMLRRRWPLVSFTMLPLALVMNVSRRNGMVWDAVISCEMSGVYKPDPETYRTTARWLNLEPSEILMVACHNFDLDAARAAGYRCAFVRRPQEWGPAGPPDPHPNPASDFVAEDLLDLARQLQSVLA